MPDRSVKSDPRPSLWVGHVVLPVPDVEKSREFFARLGMRDLGVDGPVAILELRGGTHLILVPGEAPEVEAAAPFDLMVDDLDASHRRFRSDGLDPSDITEGPFHRAFTLAAPSGHRVTVNSSHVSGEPV
jgi:catechol 2,3-dioxygenase-like lactoylglutathione lyase family enzyme